MTALRGRIGCLEVSLFLAISGVIAQLLPDLVRIWAERPQAGQQTPARTVVTDKDGIHSEIQYLIYLPCEYFSGRSWPLLLFLHGSGQCGNDVQQVAKHGPPALIAHGRQMPMIVVSPQCRANLNWNPEELLMLLDHLQQRFSIDSHRVYACGYSLGGYGTWELISAAPERFAAAIPVCAGGNVNEAHCLVNLPIWAFHGAGDENVPVEDSKQMVDAIQKCGGNARLTVYKDQGHDICDLTFSQDELYDWLLQQRLKN